jgi:hypothetical protein
MQGEAQATKQSQLTYKHKEKTMIKNGTFPRAWWLWWALATAFGWAVVMPMSYGCCYYYSPDFDFLLFLPISLAAIGQGYLLRNRLKGVIIFWILVTGLGYNFSLYFFTAITGLLWEIEHYDFGDMVKYAFIIGCIVGVIPALGQFLFLSKLPKSGWWIPIGTLSFSITAIIFYSFTENDVNIYSVLFGGVLIGAAFGIPTGIFMQYLLANAETHTITSGDQP